MNKHTISFEPGHGKQCSGCVHKLHQNNGGCTNPNNHTTVHEGQNPHCFKKDKEGEGDK